MQSTVAAALWRRSPKPGTSWRGSVCNRAVGGARQGFWSAAGSEAPHRFGFCRRRTHEVGIATTVGNDPKRRRRCALPAQSKASHELERPCLQQGCGWSAPAAIVRGQGFPSAACDSCGTRSSWTPRRLAGCDIRRRSLSQAVEHLTSRGCVRHRGTGHSPP